MPGSTKLSLIGALAANLGIAVTKFVVAGITGSSVMLAEGIHSLVDTGNSSLMLFGRGRAARPADREHQFGYGMELYFWAFVVAMVVFGGGGLLSVYQGARAIAHPHIATSVWPNYIVLGAAFLFEGTSLVIGIREFDAYRKHHRIGGSTLRAIQISKNPAIFLTVLEDSAALVGLVLAFLGITLSRALGIPELDGVASILIGGVLALEALLLGYECRGLIIGEPARGIVLEKIRGVVKKHGIGSLEELRSVHLGPLSLVVVLRVYFPRDEEAQALAPRIEALVAELREQVPAITDVLFDLTAEAPPAVERPLD